VSHPLPVLPHHTQRLVLQPPRPEDADIIQEAIEESFEGLHLWMPWAAQMQSLEATRDFLARAQSSFHEGEDFAMSAFLRDTGEFVLSTGLHPRNWHVPKFEIGYWCRAAKQGRGYTMEAVRAVTQIAFLEMAANRVEIRCDARNHRSRRVAELAGFRCEAELRADDRANDGTLRDTVVYVMLSEGLSERESPRAA